MKKTKMEKGITLIALIITIVVLLILAVVTIVSIRESKIITHAKNARSEYEQAQTNETAMLDSYLKEIDDATSVFNDITAANYGDKIEYTAGGVSDWRVFYKDADHLYIIASDYLENTKLPNTSDTFANGLNMSTSSTYGAYWKTTSNFTSAGASAITSKVAEKYGLSWLTAHRSDTSEKARATADLLNTTAWTAKFGNSEMGIEAIGSPTLEMWVASWNAKGYTKLYAISYETGYYVGTTENQTSHYQSVSSDIAGYADELYFPYTSSVSNCFRILVGFAEWSRFSGRCGNNEQRLFELPSLFKADIKWRCAP